MISQFQVKWKDYPTAQNTWEPIENLAGCEDLRTPREAGTRSAGRAVELLGVAGGGRPRAGHAGVVEGKGAHVAQPRQDGEAILFTAGFLCRC